VNKQRIGIALLAISINCYQYFGSHQHERRAEDGPNPIAFRVNEGAASEGYLVADQYGYVHCFWTETLFRKWRYCHQICALSMVQHGPNRMVFMSPARESGMCRLLLINGDILHITWSEGLFGVKAYYTYAPANDAISVQNWAKPIRINVPARPVYLQVDSNGILHILYIDQTRRSGVYYVRSEDGGIKSWSEPAWLDPDIPPGYIPDSLNFELDENDGLHAVWFYGSLETVVAAPDWVRYIHSLDGGDTWSAPFLIDERRRRSDHNLTAASPKMIVQGRTVHVIWAAGSLPYRYHRFSTDAGLTWNVPVQIFGELHGQAFDGLVSRWSWPCTFFWPDPLPDRDLSCLLGSNTVEQTLSGLPDR
jgi:hypothetical protein